MNQEDFTRLVERINRDTSGLLISKGAEYAGSADRLANFKRGAQLTGTTPLQVALVYLSKHYDALATYIKNDAAGNKQILSEPIQGRLNDLINYCYLVSALIEEASPLTPQSISQKGLSLTTITKVNLPK